MKIFINCTEANNVCDKNQYKEAGFWSLIALNIHLIWCKFCRRYSARNNKLTSLMNNSNIKTMPMDAKVAMKERLHKEMRK